jgi:hypothetical protein
VQLLPTTKLGDRFTFEGERLLDKVTGCYYVPECWWVVERMNEKLERAAEIADSQEELAGVATYAPERIRALKETV